MSESKIRFVITKKDEMTFKSCCTQLFRWVRNGIAIAEDSPSKIKGLADDIKTAWRESAKK